MAANPATHTRPSRITASKGKEQNPENPAEMVGCGVGCDTVESKTMGEEGFEPPKAFANRFTVCPDWPLRHSPGIQLWVAPEVEREFTHAAGG
jgi:hypothetical protein